MLKEIPHKNLILLILFLMASWAGKAQINIEKDGNLCPNGRVKLSFKGNLPDIVVYKWEILRNASAGWSALDDSTSAYTSTDEAGSYRLTLKDNLGKKTPSNIIIVSLLTAPSKPIVTTQSNKTQICQGDSLLLSTQTQAGASFYYWTYNGGTSAIANSPQIFAKKNGFYKISVSDGVCSTLSDSIRIDYKTIDVAKLNPVPIYCSVNYAPTNLIATPAGGRFKGKGITDEKLGSFDPMIAGTGRHNISYTILSTGGGCGDLVDNTTIVIAAPMPKFTTSTGKFQFCEGDNPTLIGAANFKTPIWSLNGNQIAYVNNLQITVGGDYEFKATDPDGCLLFSKNKVEFFPPTSVTLDPIKSVCGTEFPAVPLLGNPTGGIFTVNGQSATVFDYKKWGVGKHKVTYQTDGSLPCLKGTADQEVLIQQAPNFDLGEDILLGKGNSIMLKSPVDATSTYSWSPATDLDNPTLPNPTASPVVTNKYVLIITTSLGCSAKDSINIIIYQPIYIPTAFSPNADSMNDQWELAGMEAYPSAEVQIFNRWGNMVFYSKGDYRLTPFDGNNKNNLLPEGMYVYKINPFPDRPDFQYKGTFMLLR